MNKTVYYRSYCGDVWDRADIEKAFYISTGNRAFDHEKDFLVFLASCFGKSIASYCSPSVRDLVEMGEKVKAVKLYREENGCSLRDAKQAVDFMWEEFDAPVLVR